MLNVLMFPVPYVADEMGEEKLTVADLVYDAENASLQGRTTPNANISLENVVGEVVADDQGHFVIPVDDQAETIKLMVFDYLTNQSVTLTYDLVNQTLISPGEETNTIASKDTKETSSFSKETMEKESNSKKSVVPQLLFVTVIFLGGGSLALLAYNKKQP